MGFFEGSSGNSPGRTSRLTLAASTACMVANMCTSARGPPTKLSHEDEKAGALLSRVSALTSRPVVEVYRPDREPQPPARPASSAAHARSSFSAEITPLVQAVASIAAGAGSSSRDATPRAGAEAAGFAECGGALRNHPQQQQQQLFAEGSPQDVKAAFMKWLQEEMPQALSSVQPSAAASPRPDAAARGQAGQGGLYAMQEEVLQGLTSTADLGSSTTEDTAEGEWLEQQRQAQQLHEFYSARAAQGELLRGSLASSLRASTSSLWAAPGSSDAQLKQRQQGSRGSGSSSRPTSAPVRMRAGSVGISKPGGRLIGEWCSPRSRGAPASSRAGCTTQRPTSSSSRSRPGSPSPGTAGSPTCPRTPSPGCCRSPAINPARPSSAAGSSKRHAAGSPSLVLQGAGAPPAAAAGVSRPQSPWGPTVVEYRQQPAAADKPWQVANQLLVAAADEVVVQELAGAATDLMDGRLPAHGPPSMLRSSMQRKAALELQVEQLQPCKANPSASVAQQQEQQHVEQQLAGAAAEGRAEQAPGPKSSTGFWAVGGAQLPPASCDVACLGVTDCTDGVVAWHADALGDSQRLLEQQQQPWLQAQHACGDGQQLGPASVSAAQSTPHVTWQQESDGHEYAAAGSHAGSCAATASSHGGWHGLVVDCSSPGDAQLDKEQLHDEDAQASLLLQHPNTGYAFPNHGTLHGKQYIPELRGMFSSAVADSLRRSKQHTTTYSPVGVGSRKAGGAVSSSCADARPGQAAKAAAAAAEVPEHIPRPVTVLDVSGEVVARPVQVLVKGRPDNTLPDRLFNFHSPDPPADPNLCMHVFEHCDGAQFCADLYGHYLLPNGKLAHIFLPPAASKQGHCVAVPPPPATPWTAADWLPQDGLPAAPAAETVAGMMQPGGAVLQLPLLQALNWVPVPHAPPQPAVCSLSAARDSATGTLSRLTAVGHYHMVRILQRSVRLCSPYAYVLQEHWLACMASPRCLVHFNQCMHITYGHN
ncbi:hypothetical protein COO60DRAFT_1228411 [Scenedesmus sp. NREL 46B-D3]|nr:hypothetical protein COO60DRAFT_1228411 [Scenedesmus sp. NREL 46B-D3]